MSKTQQLEKAMNINQTNGVSQWHKIADLEAKLGFPLHGNGATLIQSDRGLGLKYAIEKQTDKGSLSEIRTVGLTNTGKNKAKNVPKKVRELYKDERCVICGTGSNIECDHKDGDKEMLSNDSNPNNYQPLCKHCNAVKREQCSRCRQDKKRFDAKSMGYPVSWTQGNSKFQAKTPRCLGCFYNSPVDFRKAL